MNKPEKKIRVLIADDSDLARDLLRAMLSEDAEIQVVGEAVNGMQAIAKVASLKPDVVTMDLEMPIVGGLEAIEKIMAENPVPILVVTSLTGVKTAFSAISKGAMDVIEKPDISLENTRLLIRKIRYLSNVNVVAHLRTKALRERPKLEVPLGKPPEIAVHSGVASNSGIVAIASSTGGPQAINTVLSHLPASFPLPIVVSQHIANGFSQGMADWLNNGSPLTVSLAKQGEELRPGHVYINPAEHSMRITGQGIIMLGERSAGVYQPCCNTLLASVAATYRHKALGLIMSGMGDDGVNGIKAIREAGGVTLAQDAATSVIYGMNRIAIESGAIQKVLALDAIPAELLRRAGV